MDAAHAAPSVIALQLSFDADTFWRILAAWGEPG